MFENSDILSLRKVIGLECIDEFANFGSREGHCFGMYWRFRTFCVSGELFFVSGVLFWGGLENLDMLGLRRVMFLDCIG